MLGVGRHLYRDKRRIRTEANESPVTLLRVLSALAFQREALEIWDLEGLRLLRRMSKTCPLIVDSSLSSSLMFLGTPFSLGFKKYMRTHIRSPY
ncbi:unnamed protein product [Cylicostephanus goldi]|uniref:Uncharacterized protein n=1 Tax=Cylicostephanus goldi TaxID=71465 RepID=A0A3P6TRY5_CYLGO|nr:unnamed protein product [Cylicostephanus goldi]